MISQLPTYLGDKVEVVLDGGKQFASLGGELKVFMMINQAKLRKSTTIYLSHLFDGLGLKYLLSFANTVCPYSAGLQKKVF